jgi:hypothetical protein
LSKTTFEDIQRLKKPNENSVELIANPELTRSMEELVRRHTTEKRRDDKENRPPKAPAIQKEIDLLTEEIENSKITFTFRDPGRQQFDKLVDSCPPTDHDKKVAKEAGQGQPGWNPEAFVPGLLSLAAIKPKLTLDNALAIYNEWGRGDVEALFNAALQACLEQASVPFTRKDTDEILASVQNLITQQAEESPIPSS